MLRSLSRVSRFTCALGLVLSVFHVSSVSADAELQLIKSSFNSCVLTDLHSSGTLMSPSRQPDLGLGDLKGKYALNPDRTSAIALRLNQENANELTQIFDELGDLLKDNDKFHYVLDEITGLDRLDDASKARAVSKIILDVKKWNPSGVKGRLIAHREKRLSRQVEKARTELAKKHPNMAPAKLDELAKEEGMKRRMRSLQLARSCSTLKPNPDSIRAARLFMGANLAFSIGGTGVTYAYANWEQMKNEGWVKRLGYEVFMAGVLSVIYGKIAKSHASTFTGKVVQGNTVGFVTQSIDAGVYSAFFSNDSERARAHIEQLRQSPTFEEDMRMLNKYLHERGHIQKFVDTMGDEGNNLLRQLTGRETLTDLTPDEIASIKPDALKDPEILERLMDNVEDYLYAEELGGNTWGNKFFDRLAFDVEWNLMPYGVPRSVLVGIISYQAICRNIDSPLKALVMFGAIQVANRAGSSVYYYQKKSEEINQ